MLQNMNVNKHGGKSCWEIMKCGMEQDGKNAAKLGVF